MMQLIESMQLAGQNLLDVLNPERDYAPTGGWLVTHDTGRWWDAMLRLEAATGFIIPAHLEGAMLANLQRFTDNPDGLLFVPPDLGWAKPNFDLHSLREGLLAFHALARYRHSRWAAQRGHRMLETLRRALQPDGTWDIAAFDYARHVDHAPSGSGMSDMTASSGRLIEALVWFYEVTGDALALELADAMASYHLAHTTTPDGPLPEAISSPANVGHSHSYLGTLRGLLLYGLLTGQRVYVERVAAAYRLAVPRVVKESGWAAHDLGQTRFKDRLGNPVPEVACAGDAAQLALWLALRAGYGEYLDDAQRWVNARLLPSQITAADVAREGKPFEPRVMGAFGGVHGLPHGGKNSTIDVTAAVLHSLVDIYTHVAVRSEVGLSIPLHFDYQDESVRVAVRRDAETATVTVQPVRRENLLLRVPGWTPPASVSVTVGGEPYTPKMVGQYVHIPADIMPALIVLRYALPARETVETTATGGEYHFTWRGDQIVGICPNDDYRPFYPTASIGQGNCIWGKGRII